MGSTENDNSYFIRIRGRILGPYSIGQLKTLRARGQFGRANEISTDRETWQSAATIERLIGDSATGKKSRKGAEDDVSTGLTVESAPPSRSLTPIWYYAVGEEQSGPVTLLEIRGMIANKQLVVDDLVWKEGIPDWVSVRDVPELNAVANAIAVGSNSLATPGVNVGGNFCYACGSPTDARAEMCPKCGVRQRHSAESSDRNRLTAAVLAFFVGGFGVHHFYLGNTFRGVMYLLFCWTLIPSIIAFIDFIILLCMSEKTFEKKYGNR